MFRSICFVLLSLVPAGVESTIAAPPTDAESAAFWEERLAARAAERAAERDRDYPAVTAVGLAAPGLLSVTILEGIREPGAFGPYEERAGDAIDREGALTRDGRRIGQVVAAGGPRGPQLWAFDTVKGERIDRDRLDDPAAWTVRIDGRRADVTAVARKSTPRGRARDGSPHQFVPFSHACLLTLDPAPKSGQRLTVAHDGRRADGGGIALEQAVTFDPRRLESPSIHVNQHGWHPADAAKRAYLSLWNPGAGEVGAVDFRQDAGAAGFDLRFEVIPAAGGAAVAAGPIGRRIGPRDPEEAPWQLFDDGTGTGEKVNSARTHVFEMNFGPEVWPNPAPGEYRVVVAGLGCSRPFRVDERVWEDAFRVGMAGLYNHRAGVELDGRYGYARPRTLHPADGFTVYQSELPIVVTGEGISGIPIDYRVGATDDLTDEPLPDAWGGLNDAGDWDRRTQHLDVVYDLLDLYERFPDYFGTFGLNLPDTAAALPDPLYRDLKGDADLPDLLAEATFTLDFFRRLQRPDGGVRGGVEEDYPDGRDGSTATAATSWTTAETPFAYAPDAWTTYQYAAAAAKAAGTFEALGRNELAAAYRQSGLRAWRWAEGRRDAAGVAPFFDRYVEEGPAEKRAARRTAADAALERVAEQTAAARAWAAAERWRLTGEEAYREALFDASDQFSKDWPTAPNGLVARAMWAVIDNPAAPNELKTFCRASLARSTTEYGTDAQGRMAFRQFKHLFVQYVYGAGTSPDEFLRSAAKMYLEHRSGPVAGPVTQLADTTAADRRAGLIDALNFTLGGNPRNLSFVVGLGENPAGVLHLDSYTAGADPPIGVVQYGFAAPKFANQYWWLFVGGEAWSELWDKTIPRTTPRRAIEPDRLTWPTAEGFIDHPFYPMMTEYTVQQGVVGFAHVAGVLAATAGGE